MNNVQIYIFFQLLTSITTLLYPCQYLDSIEHVLKCDLCQCLLTPKIGSTASLCTSTTPLTCSNNTNEESIRFELNQIADQTEKQLELHNLNHGISNNNEQLCSLRNFSQITFFNFIYNQLPKCLSNISTVRFGNSFIQHNAFHAEVLIFYNTTFDITNLNLTSTKFLTFHSVEFLLHPFELKSLLTLTHLTITNTDEFDLIGSFPHLSYLNLDHTNLNDKQLNKIFSQINTPDLTVLSLVNNQLTIITHKFPSTIRYLDLSKNQIKSLDYYSFKSLYSLNMLNLSYNSPLEIQQDTFTRIPYLEILDLSYSLPTLAFDDLFLPLQKLRHLNISANYLDTLPQLPIPYDAHTIESYDQHLPVLYVDLSNNNFATIDFEIFSFPSTYDKYILSLNMNNNHLKTFEFPGILFNDTKRRGPFIELDIINNPLQCDCSLYESITHLFQNHTSYQKQTTINITPSYKQTPPTTDLYSSSLLYHIRTRRQNQLIQQIASTNSHTKQTRIKLLHLANLTCTNLIDSTVRRSLLDLNSWDSFCPYTKYCPSTCPCCSLSSSRNTCDCYFQCPTKCSCKHSFDLTYNYVNCSNRQLTQIPTDIPRSTTHLYLNNNQIKSIQNHLTYLTNLKYLSLASNRLERLSLEDFSTIIKTESLDLSSNHIENIERKTFTHLINLNQLYLHNNPWIPRFYNRDNEFQANIHLNFLTYANGLLCNRSTTSSVYVIERPLTAEDCCKYSHTDSCQKTFHIDKTKFQDDDHLIYLHRFLSSFSNQRYILISFILLVFVLVCVIMLFICRIKKRRSLSKDKYLSNHDLKKPTNLYDTKGLKSHNTYNDQGNDNSLSYTDEDDYASIPLTMSQTDLSSVNHSQPFAPPLPPPRHRPVSHSSTTSTSITIQSAKSPYSCSLTTTRSCLQIKLDVLVLYSINDSTYVHDNLAEQLETMYGKRFSFYYIHRDRMLGELEWLIENSCITLLILRKPYNLIHDYMKILSNYSTIKCFIILFDHDPNHRSISIKVREKIARLYRTSDIYEWNSNPTSLIHEQLEIFLEQNCGSATYVTD